MRLERFYPDHREYLTLFSKVLFPNKTVDSSQTIVVGASGHGKTLCAEKITEELHKLGAVVIEITEKPGAPLEGAFCAFKPTAKHHLDRLKEQKLTPSSKKIKIYHPITINEELKKKLPPINFYTIPIKNLTEQELTVLLETETKNYSIQIIQKAISDLKPNETLLDLIYKCEQSISQDIEKHGKINVNSFDDDFYIQVPQAGSKKNISDITTRFRPFSKHYFLQPTTHPLNLDIKKILNDQEHYHFFSTYLIENKKIKYFTINYILNQIEKHAQNLKYPIVLRIPEVNVFLPDTTEEIYIKKTAINFEVKLKTLRTNGVSSISDSQGFYALSQSYRDSSNNILIGRLNLTDLDRMSKTTRMSPEKKQKITQIPKNTYYILGEKDMPIAIFFPTHAHKEERENFFQKYKTNYPENMQDYKELYQEIIATKQQDTTKAKERQKQTITKLIEKAQQKQQEQKNTQTQPTTSILKQAKQELNQTLKHQIYLESKLNPENNNPKSYNQLAKQHNITDKTAKKYAEEIHKQTQEN